MTDQSIFEKVLGHQFEKLHPMMQKRYQLRDGETFVAKGVMKQITGGPKWLYPLWILGTFVKLVFPERGQNIPFEITNWAYIKKDGTREVHWERTFYFQKKTRYFNAVMSYDQGREIIKDYLGEPSPLYSDLKFSVCPDGGLKIDSVKQRLVLGKLEIPLPKVLYGVATVFEKYNDEKQCYQISVTVKNRIIGTVFSYEGEFNV